jgi:hypothetical protein
LLSWKLIDDYQEMRRWRFCKKYSDSANHMMVRLLLQYLIRLSYAFWRGGAGRLGPVAAKEACQTRPVRA